jgi:hypothetical protein
MTHEIGTTFRSTCCNARLTYHPEWSENLPWVSYIRGSASKHYPTLDSGVVGVRRDWGYTILTTLPKE